MSPIAPGDEAPEVAPPLLAGRIAVVTGTSSGIGRSTAELFARHGARLICIDRLDPGESAERLRAEGADAHFIHADVADQDQVDAAAARCAEIRDRVDILFCNAGAVERATFEQTTPEVWRRMIDVNLSSCFLTARAFLPLLRRSADASVILHASIDATLGNPHIAAYSAAKGALLPLTHVMAHNLGRYGIRVNCISSGGINTGMRTEFASRIEVTPLARIGRPEEVAHSALFLACPWSSFVNGANLVVDGGRSAITPGVYHR